MTLCSDFVFLIMSVFSSNKLHDSMLFSILRSTLYFFESTPSGRIINRFSNDIDSAERRIPESFKSLIRCVYSILFTVIVISSSTPFFLVAFVPILILYVLIQVIKFNLSKCIKSIYLEKLFKMFISSVTLWPRCVNSNAWIWLAKARYFPILAKLSRA